MSNYKTSEKVESLPQMIGRNVRRLRAEHTLEQVADAGREYGAPWSSGSVRGIERGEFKATIETLALLALSLTKLNNGRPVAVSEFFNPDGEILVAPKGAQLPASDLLNFLSGENIRANLMHSQSPNGEGLATTTEMRLSEKIGISVEEFRKRSILLWGKTFEQKRNELAGEKSTPQKKGRVSRMLLFDIQSQEVP